MDKNIKELKRQGYTTIFIFKNASKEEILKEIESIKEDVFIFLNNIEDFYIDLKNYPAVSYGMNRVKNEKEEFLHMKDSKWKILRGNYAALGFKVKDGEIINCEKEESVYHCFLPTLDETPFFYKINADFSTDPSRKHVVFDKVTEKAMYDVINLTSKLIDDALNGIDYTNSFILSTIIKKKNYSKINQIFLKKLEDIIRKIEIRLNSGNYITIQEYKKLPDWLEEREKYLIRRNCDVILNQSLPLEVYENIYLVEEFIEKNTSTQYSEEDISKIFEDESLFEKIPKETIIKVYTKIMKKAYYMTKIGKYTPDLSKYLKNISDKNNYQMLVDEIINNLTDNEIMYFGQINNLEFPITNNCKKTLRNKEAITEQKMESHNIKRNPIVYKWRSAEFKVVELEQSMGNLAKDVSKMNVGYDVESKLPNGEKKYIEVKYIGENTKEFTITNNEYTAAHQYNENYFICLVFEKKVIYIQNPLKRLNFTKRIRQWEWVCDEYEGEEIVFDFI